LSLRPGSCGVNQTGLLLCGVTREIGELGVKKERIGKRTRYFGIALKSAEERKADPRSRAWQSMKVATAGS